MLQIHGIFNLVATLYETRLLQPKISIWEVTYPTLQEHKLYDLYMWWDILEYCSYMHFMQMKNVTRLLEMDQLQVGRKYT